jgi:hypothetical protein
MPFDEWNPALPSMNVTVFVWGYNRLGTAKEQNLKYVLPVNRTVMKSIFQDLSQPHILPLTQIWYYDHE